jgi:hypothetical protein
MTKMNRSLITLNNTNKDLFQTQKSSQIHSNSLGNMTIYRNTKLD